MKIKMFTTWGNVKAQRVATVESIDILHNEIHVVSDGWRSPLLTYSGGYWYANDNRKFQAIEIVAQ